MIGNDEEMSYTQSEKDYDEDCEVQASEEYSSSNYSSSSQSSFTEEQNLSEGEQAEDMDMDEGIEQKQSATQSATQMTFKHSESAQKSAFGKLSAV